MVLFLVYLGNTYKVIFCKVLSSYCFIVFFYIFFYKLSYYSNFFFNLNSFNYLALNMPALGLYINFFGKVLYFYYCGLLGNFRYFF